ncbi:hypothetical protein C7H19_24860 [Aphanothece hegewaldii CCALA 016]|uniref:Uncharacterized protein n=1 Tax=Aphanothece hegewaldii CCALA 016 TaxID=2107694 RepID=A0A2T1LQH1_9CHRO|nr:hypothetical protein [Aphanothece hegewaldii]PSF27792.1 hypothetical protein C7H19_24860 [Aphanothece hegewaldii CCALA 016]
MNDPNSYNDADDQEQEREIPFYSMIEDYQDIGEMIKFVEEGDRDSINIVIPLRSHSFSRSWSFYDHILESKAYLRANAHRFPILTGLDPEHNEFMEKLIMNDERYLLN